MAAAARPTVISAEAAGENSAQQQIDESSSSLSLSSSYRGGLHRVRSSDGSASSTSSGEESLNGKQSREEIERLALIETAAAAIDVVGSKAEGCRSRNSSEDAAGFNPLNQSNSHRRLLVASTFIIAFSVMSASASLLQQRTTAMPRKNNHHKSRRRRGAPIVRRDDMHAANSLLLHNSIEPSLEPFALPDSLGMDHEEEAYDTPDHGGLQLDEASMGLARHLQKHDDRYLDWYREDLMQEYFDDHSEEGMWTYGDAYRHPVKACNRPEAVYTPRPNCNNFHEFSLGRELSLASLDGDNDENSVKFLGHGFYRDAWLMPNSGGSILHKNNDKRAADQDANVTVLKQTRYQRTMNRNRMQKVLTEAVILDMLTASPRISNIYGHCAFSVTVEAGAYDMEASVLPHTQWQNKAGYIAQEMLDQLSVEDAHPLNNYTAEEKLDMLLQMTESMADAHGLPTGPVVSGDVAVDQWLRSRDGSRILLNDFDSAVFMAFNLTSHKYCRYRSGPVGGFKTPEEHRVDYLDESVDMWKIGSLIFAVLTGLKPYYDAESIDAKWARIDAGELPYLDPRYATRSLIEGRLVEIMKRCQVVNPAIRATIFEVVAHMRETKRLHEKEKQHRQRLLRNRR